MGEHRFFYFFKEGLTNMISHGFRSFAAVGITVACLLIMGTFTLVAVNADYNLRELESENEILAYVEDTYTQEEAKKLQSMLEVLPNVSSVEFISREQAMESFVAQYPEEELFQNLDPNIIQDRFAIRVYELSELSDTIASVKSVKGIESVNGYEEVAGGFVTVRNIATVVCVALIVILFVVSVFIISNTVRLTTLDRREEIAIMRMVGATNSFIRWPFVYEGFLMGILSAFIAFFCQWGLYSAMATGVTNSDGLQLIAIMPFMGMWKPVAIAFVAAGLLMGVGGSLSAIRKFLRV